jgi:hypothetical protein
MHAAPKHLCGPPVYGISTSHRECGGIGRRAGFRYQWVKPCRFESGHSHEDLAARKSGERRFGPGARGSCTPRSRAILLGKRKGAHGAGEYASPGGHLEHLERFATCAAREVREETGIEIGPIRFLRVLNITQ